MGIVSEVTRLKLADIKMDFLGSCRTHFLLKANMHSELIVSPAEQQSNLGRWRHTMTSKEREIVSFMKESKQPEL